MKLLTELGAWKALEKQAKIISTQTVDDQFKTKEENKQFIIQTDAIKLDYSRQNFNHSTLDLLLELAKERQLKEKIQALMNGGKVNTSENRPALHTALRHFDESPILVDGHDIMPEIRQTREKMQEISEKIRKGQWLGYSGQPICDIVNIGIGGSDFGPRFCINALGDWIHPDLGFHFISDADPYAFEQVAAKLKPETTLFIISSKSFTTTETLYNTKKALDWINHPQHIDKHFIAVTAHLEKASQLGFNHILPIWDWVGGRYSFCSAINLIACIAIGYESFTQLLAGANQMDKHFYTQAFTENMPVILALAGLWNINFLHIESLLFLVYANQLELFIPYIQQLDMESNGKSIDNQGQHVPFATGPIIWGGLGNQAQHSYYQLLCQGTHPLAIDFISTEAFDGYLINAFCKAKMNVLSEGVRSPDNARGIIQGGIPLNHLSLSGCTPYHLGSLIALYEHKVYVQGVIWNINSFDQPGVESAKKIFLNKHNANSMR